MLLYAAQPLMLKKACYSYKRIIAYGLRASRRRRGLSRDCFGRWEPGTAWEVVWRSDDGLLVSVVPQQMPQDLGLPVDHVLPEAGVIGSKQLAPASWFTETVEEALQVAEQRMYPLEPVPEVTEVEQDAVEVKYFQGVLEFVTLKSSLFSG